jgi:hypothetical protein
MAVANTLAYYDTATITAVKSFIAQASGKRLLEIDTGGLCCKTFYGRN